MDEMIRLYGYMWNVEGAAEKLCKVVVILLFGVWLCAAAGSLEDSGADAFGYSVSGGFAQSRTEAGGELGVALPEVSKGIFPAVPAPTPAPAADMGTREGTADIVSTAIPVIAPAESSAIVSVIPGGVDLAEEQEEAGALPAMLTIHLYGNGGSPAAVTVTEQANAFSAENWSIPQRPGKVFDGWYLDVACTRPFEGVEEGADVLELYAGWRELEGFVSDDAGHILSCAPDLAIVDGTLVLPSNSACTGIEAGALADVADQVVEIYIPANIRYIAPGAFDGLPNLMYIEAEAGNPNYYSANGILYTLEGEIAACPAWYMEE